MIESTRLRHISSSDLAAIEQFIESLPWKVELKTLVVKQGKFYQSFVLPELELKQIANFLSVDLDK